MYDFIEIEGNRIKLIDLDKKYIEDIHEYSVLPEFYKHLEYPSFKKAEDTAIFFEKLHKRSNGETCHYWLIFLKDRKKVIGTIGLHDIDWRKGSGELTYGLSPLFWGNGYFNEAIGMVIHWFFKLPESNRLFLKTSSKNGSSISAVMKIGFKKEGVMRDFYLDEKTKIRWDAVLFSMLKSEFKK